MPTISHSHWSFAEDPNQVLENKTLPSIGANDPYPTGARYIPRIGYEVRPGLYVLTNEAMWALETAVGFPDSIAAQELKTVESANDFANLMEGYVIRTRTTSNYELYPSCVSKPLGVGAQEALTMIVHGTSIPLGEKSLRELFAISVPGNILIERSWIGHTQLSMILAHENHHRIVDRDPTNERRFERAYDNFLKVMRDTRPELAQEVEGLPHFSPRDPGEFFVKVFDELPLWAHPDEPKIDTGDRLINLGKLVNLIRQSVNRRIPLFDEAMEISRRAREEARLVAAQDYLAISRVPSLKALLRK